MLFQVKSSKKRIYRCKSNMVILALEVLAMKIQEMRPGLLHLNRRLAAEKREDLFEFFSSSDEPEEAVDSAAPLILSELDQPRWSVVSFERREASGLAYRQAAALLQDLDSRGVTGLCIITDDAADRVKG
jgi:hypothetical protein